MKLEQVTKLEKRNKTLSKNFNMTPCHLSDLWLIWSNPEAGFQTHNL